MLTRAWSPPEEQTIGVVRKGSRALQHLPASADAFVWLRLYQQEMLGPGSERAGRAGVVDAAPSVPPSLTYDATWMVFTRVNRMLGANWTLHALRHSAARKCWTGTAPVRTSRPGCRYCPHGWARRSCVDVLVPA